MGRRMLAAVACAALALGHASLAEGCGSVPDVGDAAVPDATADGQLDAQLNFDVGANDATPDVVFFGCLDAGYFITIAGDGPTQTLAANNLPSVNGNPESSVPWAQAYLGQGLILAGSKDADGGANIRFDVEIKENADGGLTNFGPGAAYSYAYYMRADGTLFSPTSGDAASASMTLTTGDPPGGVVAGSYTLTVVDLDSGTNLSLSGTFSTCRLPDAFVFCCPHNGAFPQLRSPK